jgi:T5orf172 domain.
MDPFIECLVRNAPPLTSDQIATIGPLLRGERIKPPQLPTYLYFIKSGAYVKIGISTDPKARIRELSTGNPDQLVLIGKLPFDDRTDAGMEESRWHAKFETERVRGEWFRITPRILSAISEAIR